MAKEEWGTKRVCPTTGKRFYDLNKNPIISPYTGEEVSIDAPKGRTMIAEKTASKAKETETEEVEDDVVLEEDEDVDIDDDLLEDDDEDDNVSLDDIADVSSDEDES